MKTDIWWQVAVVKGVQRGPHSRGRGLQGSTGLHRGLCASRNRVFGPSVHPATVSLVSDCGLGAGC